MFNIPISGVEIILFSGILLLWAGLLFGGFIFGKSKPERRQRMPVWSRLASSFVLALSAWIWFAISQGTQVGSLTFWLATGMTLSFLGDIFMAHLLKLEPYILYGTLAFGAGHIAYIIGLLNTGTTITGNYPDFMILAIWWIIALIAWLIIIFRNSKRSIIIYAALPYSILLSSTVGLATTLAINNPAFIPLAIGAGLFLISDLILAAELFNNLYFPLIGDAVWLTYGPGQMLIIYSLIFYTAAQTLVGST